MKNISAVVINYNGKEFLEICLRELLKHDELSEIIVVDDASDDGSADLVRNQFKQTRLIVNKENSGPIFSRQVGFENSKGEYVLFVDCDALIERETANNLLKFLKANDDFWLAGSKLYEKEGSDTPWNFGHFPCIFKNLFLFALKGNKNFGKETKEVDWVAEACFMVKREVFEKIGGFDDTFFMYHEAPDISIRAKGIGFKTAIVFESQAIHLSQKSKLLEKDRFFVFNEALKYFYKKHYSKTSFLGITILLNAYYLSRKIGIKPETHYE